MQKSYLTLLGRFRKDCKEPETIVKNWRRGDIKTKEKMRRQGEQGR